MGGSHIPENIFNTDEVKTLWFELNRHITIFNDMVSLKKEIVSRCADNTLTLGMCSYIKQGKSLHSLVPIIIHQTGADLDTVVESLVETLRTSGKSIDQAAERLLLMAESDGEVREKVEAYLYSFWTNMTGSYWWSYVFSHSNLCLGRFTDIFWVRGL